MHTEIPSDDMISHLPGLKEKELTQLCPCILKWGHIFVEDPIQFEYFCNLQKFQSAVALRVGSAALSVI